MTIESRTKLIQQITEAKSKNLIEDYYYRSGEYLYIEYKYDTPTPTKMTLQLHIERTYRIHTIHKGNDKVLRLDLNTKL